MYSLDLFRSGDGRTLADIFISEYSNGLPQLYRERLEDPKLLAEDDIMAVHFAAPGAQGEGGAVEILYSSQDSIRMFYGNYVYKGLDLDAVIQKLPILKQLDTRGSTALPYPFGGSLDVPENWTYLYMGAMNHFFVRKDIYDRAEDFLNIVEQEIGGAEIFTAAAWFCCEQLPYDPEVT